MKVNLMKWSVLPLYSLTNSILVQFIVITRVTSGGSGFFTAGCIVLGCVPQANNIYSVSNVNVKCQTLKFSTTAKDDMGVTETLTVPITLSSKHDKSRGSRQVLSSLCYSHMSSFLFILIITNRAVIKFWHILVLS